MNENILYVVITTVVSIFVVVVILKNYLFLVIAPWYNVKEALRLIKATKRLRAKGLDGDFRPKVSVIIPAWNEEVGILKTVKSVLYNGYDNLQIVVVNDGSTDNSDKKVKDFIKELKKVQPEYASRITYKYQQNGGKGVALNTGITLAEGDIVVTIDADSVLKKGSLAKLVNYYKDEELMGVVGNVQVSNVKNIIGLAQHLEYYFGFYNKRTHAVLDAEYIFGGACASFRREVFDKIGLYDTKNKTEDIEMTMRLRYFGYKCTYAEDVVCYTEGASNVSGLISQRVRWKKGRLDTFKKYKSMFFSSDENHNFYLSFFVLPFSLLTEIQLIFEPIAISILLIYSVIQMEFVSLLIGVMFTFLSYLITAVFSNRVVRPELIVLFPFTWPLFYFLDWIEFMALFKSLRMYMKKEEVVWQVWQRQGI